MKNLNEKFMEELSRTKDPVTFLGLATILGVDLYGEEKDEEDHRIPKEFSVMFKELMSGYDGAGRKRKRELLKILREANKIQGDEVNGIRTEDTQTTVQN